MLRSYLPAVVFLGLGTIVGIAFTLLNHVLGPRRPTRSKADPYECGLPSDVQRGFRFGESHIAYGARIGEVKLQKWRDGWLNLSFLFRKRFGLL